MKPNQAHARNVIRNVPPSIPCHTAGGIGPTGSGKAWARQTSVSSVRTPTTATAPNVSLLIGSGAELMRKRYRLSPMVQAKTIRARLARYSPKPKKTGALGSNGAKDIMPTNMGPLEVLRHIGIRRHL